MALTPEQQAQIAQLNAQINSVSQGDSRNKASVVAGLKDMVAAIENPQAAIAALQTKIAQLKTSGLRTANQQIAQLSGQIQAIEAAQPVTFAKPDSPTMAEIGALALKAAPPAEPSDNARGAAIAKYQQQRAAAKQARSLLDSAVQKSQVAGTFQLPKNYDGALKWAGATDPSLSSWTPEQKALHALDPEIFATTWKKNCVTR